jgi:malate synthase
MHKVGAPVSPREQEILTADALAFLDQLHERFAEKRQHLLARRADVYSAVVASGKLEFPEETKAVRESEWSVAPCPPALADRRVEITGPATPAKMAINALNSGAKVWLADLEDACTPSWLNLVDSQASLFDAAREQLAFTSSEGKDYRVSDYGTSPVVVMRPRGLHLPEAHLHWSGGEAVGALVDFGLYMSHNARVLAKKGRGPFFYLPKLESHLEARWWAEVFAFAEETLGIDHGTIRATVLIETIPAAMVMDEILYELREYASGLNAGRWDYLFSIIKYFRELGSGYVMPDRAQVTMVQPFMRAYTELLVKTCHRRGAHAIGGMAAAIPNRKDPEITAQAFERVRADKDREAADGFDGSWVAHPDLVPICRDAFTEVLGQSPNQVGRERPEVSVSVAELLDISSATGETTSAGVASNVYVALAYIAAWLAGNGAAAIRNLMEDVATAEISRSQLWQMIRQGVVLADTGETVTADYVARIIREQAFALAGEVSAEAWGDHFDQAQAILEDLVLSDHYVDFLTDITYRELEGVPPLTSEV